MVGYKLFSRDLVTMKDFFCFITPKVFTVNKSYETIELKIMIEAKQGLKDARLIWKNN